MKYTTKETAHCLMLRLNWYLKAIDMNAGIIPRENGFSWPTYPGVGPYSPENLYYWRGAVAELKNMLAMLGEEA